VSQLQQRRQEEKERRRNEILDAAEAVFARVGPESATMDQVARSARLSRALLYVYFDDKGDVLMGVCERGLNELRARFAASAAAHRRGLDKVRALGAAYVQFSQERPVHFDALARFESIEPDPERYNSQHSCIAAGDAIIDFMVEILEEGIADGSIRRDIGDRRLTATTLWGFMHGILQLTITKKNMLAHDGVQPDRLLRHALEMASHSIAAPAQPKRLAGGRQAPARKRT
jgi:TetR/AcrR family transcriptional regulator